MAYQKTVYENGDIEISEFDDVTDIEILKMVSKYPELIDVSDDIQDRYTRLCKLVELDGGFID